jgi:DNA helicase II / ATP-dependent DNA helicase PcrA
MAREYIIQHFAAPIDLKIDYAKELNEQQYAAVTAPSGPSLIIAGAGAGKTRTLTYRVAYLLEHRVPASGILLLTFTNKAAREMMRRVAGLLGRELPELWGGTFHAVGNRLLRRHGAAIGYPQGFTIMDQDDAKSLLNACLGEVDATATRLPKADALLDVFSMAANTCETVAATLHERFQHFEPAEAEILELHRKYQVRKRDTRVVDFDDLLVLWLELMQKEPALLEQYHRQFQYILVDEYQDTNKLQSELVDLLAAKQGNLMVVGDDAQSIYAWRGANYRNILEFPKRYPQAAIYKIETNYRSTPEILAVANAAIAANVHQFQKQLASSRKTGIKPALVPCPTALDQAAFVCQRILELRDEGVELRELAVLYRSHFHAMELQMELTRRNIPFQITSGIRFFEQAHIKDITSYLKLVVNARDELAFKRIVLTLPGVGNKGADKLWRQFLGAEPSAERVLGKRLAACATAMPKKAQAAWEQVAQTLEQLAAPELQTKPAQMIQIILEAVYEEYLQENFDNYRNRLEDIQQMAVFAQGFQNLEEFLSQLALLSNVEADAAKETRDDERIRLSTVHQAKGLEFDAVFVIMLCDGLFPNARCFDQVDKEEEERRLFYVAITRARNELYLTYPLIRATPGYGADLMQRPSRFLDEIPKDLLDEWEIRSAAGI